MKINEIPHSFKLSRVSFLQWCVKEAAVAAVFMLSLTYSRSSDQEIAFFFVLYLFYKVVYPMPSAVGNETTWDRFEPRTKISRKKKLKILNFEFCLSFKSVSG